MSRREYQEKHNESNEDLGIYSKQFRKGRSNRVTQFDEEIKRENKRIEREMAEVLKDGKE